jgi:hypothetical protein|tara:strand:- start:99 stop:296 length:198 start_codon:yes stop_codon:yes gene_type:complete
MLYYIISVGRRKAKTPHNNTQKQNGFIHEREKREVKRDGGVEEDSRFERRLVVRKKKKNLLKRLS